MIVRSTKLPMKVSKTQSIVVIPVILAVLLSSAASSHAFGLSDALGGLSNVTKSISKSFSGGNKTAEDALEGGMLGAIAGQVIGKDTKSTLIGTGIGAVGGMLLNRNKQLPPQQTSQELSAPRDRQTTASQPYPAYRDGRTKANMVTKRRYKNGELVSEETVETIRSDAVYDGYAYDPRSSRRSR